jgi:hypothetical protein
MNTLAVPIRRRQPMLGSLTVLLLLMLTACDAAMPQAWAPERPVPVREEAALALHQRWANALGSDEDPLELMATEEEITSLMALNLSTSSIEDPVVWLTPEGVHIRCILRLAGKHTLMAWLAIGATGGAPRVKVEHVSLDGHSCPRLIRLSIEQAANDALADAALPLSIEQVTLGEGSLHIVAHPK